MNLRSTAYAYEAHFIYLVVKLLSTILGNNQTRSFGLYWILYARNGRWNPFRILNERLYNAGSGRSPLILQMRATPRRKVSAILHIATENGINQIEEFNIGGGAALHLSW